MNGWPLLAKVAYGLAVVCAAGLAAAAAVLSGAEPDTVRSAAIMWFVCLPTFGVFVALLMAAVR